MEEKKILSLTTYILILIIIALGAVAGFLYTEMKKTEEKVTELNEKISDLKEENVYDLESNVDDQNQEENENNTDVTGQKFIQFDTNFFKIEEISKESISVESVYESYKEVIYDLDGDGVQDKITVERLDLGDSEFVFVFKLNGIEFDRNRYRLNLYIVDLNEDDKNVEVVVFDEGPSDDPGYTIYSKKGSAMNKIKVAEGISLMADKKGIIIFEGFMSVNPSIFEEYYIITNGTIETKKIDIENYKSTEFSCEYLYFTTDLNNIQKYFEYENEIDEFNERLEKANIQEMDKSMTFNILGFTDNYEIIVQLTNGTKGYLFTSYGHFAG